MSEQSTQRTILIVEEHESIRMVCNRKRSDQSHITRSDSPDWESFQLKEESPDADILIMDIRTAESDDYHLLTQRRSGELNIPVILYSRGSGHKRDLPTWLAGFYQLESSDLKEFQKKVKEFVDFEERMRCCWQTSEPYGKQYKKDCGPGAKRFSNL